MNTVVVNGEDEDAWVGGVVMKMKMRFSKGILVF